MALPPGNRDLTRIVLGVLVIAALLGGVFLVLRPFLPALLWATMIVVATWPLMQRVEKRLGGRRAAAVTVMILVILVILIAPIATAMSTLVEQVARLSTVKVAELRVPSPPAWLETVPVVGARIVVEWRELSITTPEALTERFAPFLRPVATWLAAQAGSAGAFAMHLVLTLLLCGILYGYGETAAHGVRRFARRLHGEQGESVVLLAAASVRAVALGIVVTALVQTALGTLGLLVAGVPYVGLLGALMFVLCIAQLGPVLPMLGAAVWLWTTDSHTAAILLAAWAGGVAMLDNVLRPLLIRRGADLPLLLIMSGVIGGLLSMGLVGLFVGPVVLAVAYRLIDAWVAEQDAAPDAAHVSASNPRAAGD